MTDALREIAVRSGEIQGIVILGSWIKGKKGKKLCRFPRTDELHGMPAELIREALKANSFDGKPGEGARVANDIDIWLLVEGSGRCPSQQDVDERTSRFFKHLSECGLLDARRVGDAKREFFGEFYKKREFYTGFLSKDRRPWNGGAFAAELGGRLSRFVHPPFEVRAFPAALFGIRPHRICGNGYRDREPLACDLKDWLGDEGKDHVVAYRTREAAIWPFLSESDDALGTKDAVDIVG